MRPGDNPYPKPGDDEPPMALASTPPATAADLRSDDEPPGIPLFRTWRSLYVFVFGAFVVLVIGLTIFSRVYA